MSTHDPLEGGFRPALAELRHTDALLDRLGARSPLPADLDDPVAGALAVLAGDLDLVLPAPDLDAILAAAGPADGDPRPAGPETRPFGIPLQSTEGSGPVPLPAELPDGLAAQLAQELRAGYADDHRAARVVDLRDGAGRPAHPAPVDDPFPVSRRELRAEGRSERRQARLVVRGPRAGLAAAAALVVLGTGLTLAAGWDGPGGLPGVGPLVHSAPGTGGTDRTAAVADFQQRVVQAQRLLWDRRTDEARAVADQLGKQLATLPPADQAQAEDALGALNDQIVRVEHGQTPAQAGVPAPVPGADPASTSIGGAAATSASGGTSSAGRTQGWSGSSSSTAGSSGDDPSATDAASAGSSTGAGATSAPAGSSTASWGHGHGRDRTASSSSAATSSAPASATVTTATTTAASTTTTDSPTPTVSAESAAAAAAAAGLISTTGNGAGASTDTASATPSAS